MPKLYLLLAALGTFIPYIFFGQFIFEHGFNIFFFCKQLFVNGAAGGFSADLLISSFVFWLWMYQKKSTKPLFFILLNLTIGLSCAFPLFLYFESRLKKIELIKKKFS